MRESSGASSNTWGSGCLRFFARTSAYTTTARTGLGLSGWTTETAMPHAAADDGVKLYYEEAGVGAPIVFVHEFAGDHRSWEPQMRFFSRRYRCIAFNARGYPPSDVPADTERYSQARARDDIIAVLDHLGIDKAHIVGLSMGGFATLHFGFRHPKRALSLCVAGCGYGAEKDQQAKFKGEVEVVAKSLL